MPQYIQEINDEEESSISSDDDAGDAEETGAAQVCCYDCIYQLVKRVSADGADR